MLVTTVVIVGGTSALFMSDFGVTNMMAKMSVPIVATALLLDFLLLPPLLLFLEKIFPYHRKKPIGLSQGEYIAHSPPSPSTK